MNNKDPGPTGNHEAGGQSDATQTIVTDADGLHAPVIGLYGEKDMSIPLETVEQMRAKLAAADDPSEIIVYPGANHGFQADYRTALYHREAAEDGWRRMLEWFDKFGV